MDVTVVVQVERFVWRCNFGCQSRAKPTPPSPYFDVVSFLAIDLTRTESRMKLSGVLMYKCCRLNIFSDLVSNLTL